ncbi:MAG TPA: CAP domain-containing protein, partial [Acidimicrobiales bacterium]|nr:CAP domain-containing protein [Acidimicrobiales bacterium]
MRSKPHARVAIAIGALALSAAVPLALPSGAQTITNCSVSSTDLAIDAEEQKLLDLINQYRATNGRNRLAFQTDVTRAAAWMSRDMATRNRFSHTDSRGRSMSTRLTQCGVSYTSAAENIAAGQTTAQAVFDAWKASSGHNTNMLRTGVTAAGIGRAYNANSTYKTYWTFNVTNTSVSSSSSTTTTTGSSTTSTIAATTTTTGSTTTT